MLSRSSRGVRVAVASLTLALAAGAGCAPATAPTSSFFQTNIFTGIVTPDTPVVHPLTTDQTSVVDITLVSLDPNPAPGITVGVGLGTPSTTGGCGGLTGLPLHAGERFTLSAVAAGTYCVEVLDFPVGTLTGPVSYTVKVNHH